MQTIQLKVDDSSVGIVMTLIENLKKDLVKEVKIVDSSTRENLDLDPYFYERQKELQQTRADIKDGSMEMLSEAQYEEEIEQFFSHIEK
ncbi:MAG: hypothetical protein HF962_01065 [Sulfurovum sp.]|nr:hypothetical protein [Sulfurovum sp.]